MLEGSLWDKILVVALPFAFTGIMQQLFNAADIAMLGQFVGKEAMAAVGSNSPIIGMVLSLFIGISLGANVIIARFIGKKNIHGVHAAVHFLTDLQGVAVQLCLQAIGDLGIIQMLSNLGADLGGITVDGLLSTEDGIELAFYLFHLPNRAGKDIAGGQRIRAAECTVGNEISLVGRDGQALLQRVLGLLGAHGHDHDLGVRTLVLDAGGSFEGIAVKGVDDAGDAVPNQGVLYGVDFNNRSIRNLLDTYKNIHDGLL